MFTQSEIESAGRKAKLLSASGWLIRETRNLGIYFFTAIHPETKSFFINADTNRQTALYDLLMECPVL